MPPEAKQAKITKTISQLFPKASTFAHKSHKLPYLVVDMAYYPYHYFLLLAYFERDAKDNLRVWIQPQVTLCPEEFPMDAFAWDPTKPDGIKISDHIEIGKFKIQSPSFVLAIEALPSSYPDRHIKGIIMGLFKQQVTCTGFLRRDSTEIAKAHARKFEGKSISIGEASGILAFVNSWELEDWLKKGNALPHYAKFPIDKDLPLILKITFDFKPLQCRDGSTVKLCIDCGKPNCYIKDPMCAFYRGPVDGRHREHHVQKRKRENASFKKKKETKDTTDDLMKMI